MNTLYKISYMQIVLSTVFDSIFLIFRGGGKLEKANLNNKPAGQLKGQRHLSECL